VDLERERLRAWMPWADTTKGPGDVRTFIQDNRASGSFDALGIFVDGAYVGGVGLMVGRPSIDGELGYWIASAHEGRGLVTRACLALIGHAFGELGLHRVTIRVAPENARSRAIPERLGFTQEGLLREAGKTGTGYVDLLVYSMLEDEWPVAM
jgi:ribosomal-protein-serine acetyltransferase